MKTTGMPAIIAIIVAVSASARAETPPPAAKPAAAEPTPAVAAPKPAPAPAPTPTTAPAPAATPATSATVTETGANVTEVKAVEVTTPAAPVEEPKPAAPAKDESLGVSVAAKLGGTLPTSALGLTYFVGLEVGYRLPLLDRLLGVAFEFSAGRPGKSGTINAPAVGGNFDYDLAQRLYILAFEANGQQKLGDLWVYAGLGYGVYLLKASMKALGATNTESQARAGMQVRGGAAYRLGPGDVFAELRYHYVGLRFLTTGRSNAGGLTLGAGYRYSF